MTFKAQGSLKKSQKTSQNLSFSMANPKYRHFQQFSMNSKNNEKRNGSQIIENKIIGKHKKLSSLIQNFNTENLQNLISDRSSLNKRVQKNIKNFSIQDQVRNKKQKNVFPVSDPFQSYNKCNIKNEQLTKKLNQKLIKNENFQSKIQCKNKIKSFFSQDAKNNQQLSVQYQISQLIRQKYQNSKISDEKLYQEILQKEFRTMQSSSCLSKSEEDISMKSQLNDQLSIDQFKLLKTLGEGSYGKVGLYKHIKSNFICAIKQIQKQQIHQQALQYIIRQIKIQTFLNHPNIVRIYAYFQDQKSIYIVMEPCIQGNLYSQLTKKKSFSQKQVKKIVKHLSNALNYMHDLDIMHRDIKPQNILIHQGVYKICDFGWAIQVPLSRGTLCGTAIYSSPQLIKQCSYDSKIDIWSIGIMAFQLLTGSIPFSLKKKEDLQNILKQNITFPQNLLISNKCKSFIFQCLEKNPKKRCSIKQLIDHQFLQ